MIDRHAPWRLIADVTSKYMHKKMFKYGLTSSNLFSQYYVPSYIYDIDVMRVVLYNWYNQYVTTYPQVKTMKVTNCKSYVFSNSVAKDFVVAKYMDRERFSSTKQFDDNFGAHYWLRQYLYVRLREVSSNISEFRFKQVLSKVYSLYRFKNFNSAVDYINSQVKKFQPNVFMKQQKDVVSATSATSATSGMAAGSGGNGGSGY